MAKAPAQWLRLALVLFVVERFGQTSDDMTLTGEQAERAERLWLDWLAPSVSAIHFSVLNRTTDRRTGGDLGAIAAWIAAYGRGTIRWEEVRQGVRALRGFDAQDGAALLAQMAANSWLSPQCRKGNRSWWVVNPRVFDLFRDPRGNPAGRATPAPAPDPIQRASIVPADEWGDRPSDGVVRVGATPDDWRAEIGPDCDPDDLTDPMGEPDPEEEAARWAAYGEIA